MKCATALVVAVLTATPAMAATVERSFTFTRELVGTGAIATKTEFLQKFDPALGKLFKVELQSRLTYSLNLTWDIQGQGGFNSLGEVWARVLTADQAGDAAPFYLIADLRSATESIGLGPLLAGAGQATMSDTVQANYVVDDADSLAGLTGPGTFRNEMLGVFYHEWESFGPGAGSTTRHQEGSYLVEGSYLFHYNAVPEPLTWAMLVSGFALAGHRLRHQKRLGLRFT